MNDVMASHQQVSMQQSALLALKQARARIETLELARSEPLAIIGAACRFPGGASTPEAYWQLLRDGVDAVTEVPADRWAIDALYDPDPEAPGKMTTRYGGFLQHIDQFDPQFFGISPREAVSMDPQQRLVLEVSWEAIERAGLAPDTLSGSQTGVFLGASTYDYSLLSLKAPGALQHPDLYNVTGSAMNIIAGRLSYTLGLRGPSMVVDTACSSALVAVHLACQSLRAGECDLAVAGGVSLMLSPELSIMFSKAHMLAGDGRCKTFDASADGFARGEGCGIILLRRLSDALAQGDDILALVRGTAVNQDGRSSGLTAPNGRAQQAVIRQALANAHVAPAQVGYVESHGTGTSLGDPIEVQALASVLREGRDPGDPVRVGAVKANIGHLEAAAGVAGLLKAVLALQHREIPPNLHLRTPNPHIPWDELPVTLPTRLTPWPSGDRPRIAGVSSFGFSGTNAHIVLEEAQQRPPAESAGERPLHLLCLSGKSEGALRELAGSYQRYLDENPAVPLDDVTHTANSGRAHFSQRAALLAGSREEMRDKLAAFLETPAPGDDPDGVQRGEVSHARHSDRPPLAFLFTGQGAQYAGMGRRLYETVPVFRRTLEQCDEFLRPHLRQSLLSVLYPDPGQATPLDHTTYTQPALFALEYALAQVWRSWGIVPSAVLGHSVGEYVAACVSGVFSLEDGLGLVAERARLMGDLPQNGAMAAVFASEEEVAEAIAPYRQVLAIAAVNGPKNTVISGEAVAVEEVSAALRAQGARVERLTVSHAFHSPLMDPVLDALERLATRVRFAEPQIELMTNLTGQRLAPGSTLDGRYLQRHAREAVHFRDGMASLHELGYSLFIEVGPSPVLLGMGRRCLPGEAGVWLPSLRKSRDDWRSMLESLGALYVHGVAVDWESFDRGYACQRAVLPTYPFQRRRYWMVERAGAGDGADAHALDTWLYQLEWQPQPRSAREQLTQLVAGHWMILADRGGVGQELAHLLEEHGASCDLIFAETWQQLQEETLSTLPPCRGVVHLWGLDATPPAATTDASLWRDQQRHCASAVQVTRTLAAGRQPNLARLWIVTRGAQQVGQVDDQLTLAQAPLWGLGRVIALEHPEIWGGLIDLDPASAAAEAMHLLEEMCAPEGTPAPHTEKRGEGVDRGILLREDQVAWRGGRRYVARLARAENVLAQPLPLRPDATYAITGGLGGLGRAIACWMAQQGARHIVLVSRSAAADSEIAQALERMGTQVQAIQADVSRADQLAAALQQIEAGMPPLRGVIHAAGVLDDGLLLQQNWKRFERVLAPKVAGAWNLHALTQALPLDFFVLFSSTASLFGSPGQGNYAAANAFLDALAHHRRASGLPALTINWGPWDEVGMAAASDARGRQRRAARGIALLTPQQGIGALAALLQGSASQVAVLRMDWTRFAAGIADESPGGLSALFARRIEEAHEQTPSVQEQRPSQPRLLEQLLALPPDRRVDFLRATLRRRVGRVLGMAPEDVPLDRHLQEPGMDSLMCMEVIRSIKQDFQLTLYPRELYEHPAIDALATYLDSELAKTHRRQNGEQPAAMASPGPIQAESVRSEPMTRQLSGKRVAPEDQTAARIPGVAFLLSGPRSGSTLLRVMLAGHPRLFCPPELHLLPFETLAHQRQELDRSYLYEGLQRALMELLGCDASASKALLDHWIAANLSIQEVYARLQHMAAPRLLVDKSPTYAGSMETLRRAEALFTDARYICLVRHPYAAIESFLRNRMHKLIGVENDDPFLVAEQVWVQTNRNLHDFLRMGGAERCHLVRYEDLVSRPQETVCGICAFLGIPFDEALLRPYEGKRMTDGVHEQSLAIGDPNFLSHDRIETDLGDAWRRIILPRPLGPTARQLAATFHYELPELAAPTPVGSLFAVTGFPASEAEGNRLPPAAAREYYVQARGLRLCVNTWGPEGGPEIVCLHGILDHSMAWEEVAAPLAAHGCRVIAPDQRGHGCSAHASTGAYHLLDYVADLDALMSTLGGGSAALPARPVVLIGHSMGAAVAATFASLRPERVSALVLIEGLMPGEPSEDEFADLLSLRLQYLASTPQHAPLPDTAAAARRLRQAVPSLTPERAQRMAERITQPCENGVCWRWDAALLTRSDLTYDTLAITPARYRALLSRITAPVTLIYGQADNPHLAHLQAALPQARVEVVPGGHNLHIDAPAALAEAIARSDVRACYAASL